MYFFQRVHSLRYLAFRAGSASLGIRLPPRDTRRSSRADTTREEKNAVINSSEREGNNEEGDRKAERQRRARSKFAERLGVIVVSGGRNLSFGGTSDGRRSRVPIVARSWRMVASSRDPGAGRRCLDLPWTRRRPLTRRPRGLAVRPIFDLEADLLPWWCALLLHVRQARPPSRLASRLSSLFSR